MIYGLLIDEKGGEGACRIKKHPSVWGLLPLAYFEAKNLHRVRKVPQVLRLALVRIGVGVPGNSCAGSMYRMPRLLWLFSYLARLR